MRRRGRGGRYRRKTPSGRRSRHGLGAGAHAEYAVTDAGRVHPIPVNSMTYEQAACFPIALQTMHNAIVTAGRLKRGESLLIQGASSGVGLLGTQIGKLLGASPVIGTSTNTQRRARLEEFGCDLALDSNNPSWPEQARKAPADNGVDVIVDMISGSVADQNLHAAAVLGRIVNVGRLGGMTGTFNFELHAFKRIDYIGVTFRTRSLDEIRAINRLMRADLWPAVQAGKLTMPICRTYPLHEIASALALMRANEHSAKSLLASGSEGTRRFIPARVGTTQPSRRAAFNDSRLAAAAPRRSTRRHPPCPTVATGRGDRG